MIAVAVRLARGGHDALDARLEVESLQCFRHLVRQGRDHAQVRRVLLARGALRRNPPVEVSVRERHRPVHQVAQRRHQFVVVARDKLVEPERGALVL